MSKPSIAIITILTITLLAVAFFWANRPRRVIIEADLPASFPTQGFSHTSFEGLLQTYVGVDGLVDYERWHRLPSSIAQLDSYLAAIAKYSPDNAPHRFDSRNDELAYWMYAYNAYVIKSVLNHWPLQSVTDVKSPLELVRGLGFFYQLRFSFGGEFYSLLRVENNKIRRQFKDPRIHFVLNCASASCPVARPGLPIGNELEKLLALATVEFINDPKNIEVDHVDQIVYLSRIFKWYEKDFVNDVRLDGKPTENGLLTYVAQFATSDLSDDIARASRYEIEYREYDWAINSAD